MIDQVSSLLSQLEDVDLEKALVEVLREMRSDFQAAEGDVSYTRRIVQGRMDIVGHELARRLDPAQAGNAPDSSGLLFDLPDILSDSATNNPPAGRRKVDVIAPGEFASELMGEIDEIASPSVLSNIDHPADDVLENIYRGLRQCEAELSDTRRQLHDAIDSIQLEIGKRYRDGEMIKV